MASTHNSDPVGGTVTGKTAVRKQLPSVPDAESRLSSVAQKTDPATSSQKGNQGYGPFFLEYSLMAEYNQLQKLKLPGVYVIPSAKSPLIWNGMLFIRQGLYQTGVFRFTLYIPENYPDCSCPRLVFECSIFHPVINPETGELDVKRAFKKWRRNTNFLWQVLLYARRVFYKIDVAMPLNPEAAVLYEKDLVIYKSRVMESIALCKRRLYDVPTSDDPHAIVFSEWDPSIHDEARQRMLHPKETQPKVSSLDDRVQLSGLSWMTSASSKIFSKDEHGT